MPILYPLSTSAEVKVAAEKKPTKWEIRIVERANKDVHVTDTTQYVGTKIVIAGKLWAWNPGGYYEVLRGKLVRIEISFNGGAFKELGHGYTDGAIWEAWADFQVGYDLDKAGNFKFRAVFNGDAQYEGCSKAAQTFAR